MSLFKKSCFLSLFLLCVYAPIQAQKLTVATYNLRNDNKGDVGNLWIQRAPIVSNLIRFHAFDIFGIQEGFKNQLEDISAALPQYAYSGAGRDDGKDGGEHSSIFYRKDKFKLLKKGDFWLSQNPDKPGLGWDATCCNRICSWVYLQDIKTGKKFYFFNTHYDHEGKVARVESSKLIISKVKEIAGTAAAIVTGDLNGNRETECYQILAKSGLLTDTHAQVQYPYENSSSFNAFGKDTTPSGVIDHVFVTRDFKASRWGVLTDSYLGKYPSDHFPVVVDITLK